MVALEQGIRDMAKELPTSREAIAGVAASAGQLGIETDNVLAFTRVMIDLGESTNLSAEEGATALARFANITGMTQDSFDKLGSSIVALGNNMATTEAEIVNMGMRIAGAGKQIGLTEPEIMGIAAALSSVGIEAEAGGSAISKTMIEIASQVATSGDGLEQWARRRHERERLLSRVEEGPGGGVNSVITGLGKMESAGGSALVQLEKLGITELRQRDALLRAAGAGDLLTRRSRFPPTRGRTTPRSLTRPRSGTRQWNLGSP
jgi:TP901 family phage tail tape measure protein